MRNKTLVDLYEETDELEDAQIFEEYVRFPIVTLPELGFNEKQVLQRVLSEVQMQQRTLARLAMYIKQQLELLEAINQNEDLTEIVNIVD